MSRFLVAHDETIVFCQVARAAWHNRLTEISRACVNPQLTLSDTATDQVGVGEYSDPDRQVEPLVCTKNLNPDVVVMQAAKDRV